VEGSAYTDYGGEQAQSEPVPNCCESIREKLGSNKNQGPHGDASRLFLNLDGCSATMDRLHARSGANSGRNGGHRAA
jgi:hypothetical protein